jgi:hypothetical protein
LRAFFKRAAVVLGFVMLSACGDSPTEPGPIVTPPPPPPPPVNSVPAIESITIQGTRPNQPPSFADLSETVDVSAVVRDQETAVDQLQYIWTATAGSFSGTGARVSWLAPAAASTPTVATLTLEVVERYGTNLEHRITRTASVALHDSKREVGDMARQFLLDFSDTNIKDASVIMRNFGTPAMCPQPNEVTEERDQVTNHFTNFRMINFRIGEASVSVNFKGACPISGKLGDACAIVPAYWHSFNRLTNKNDEVDGQDIIAAIYSTANSRWWLCASNYFGRSLLSGTAGTFYIR